MPPSSDGSRRVLRELISALAEPGDVNPGLAAHVVAQSHELLGDSVVELRPRMPTLLFPRSAVFEVPDAPPLPPGAL